MQTCVITCRNLLPAVTTVVVLLLDTPSPQQRPANSSHTLHAPTSTSINTSTSTSTSTVAGISTKSTIIHHQSSIITRLINQRTTVASPTESSKLASEQATTQQARHRWQASQQTTKPYRHVVDAVDVFFLSSRCCSSRRCRS